MKKLTQKELSEILDDHAVHMLTEGREGKVANLAHTDVSGLCMKGANLIGVDITGIICEKTEITSCVMPRETREVMLERGAWDMHPQATLVYTDSLSGLSVCDVVCKDTGWVLGSHMYWKGLDDESNNVNRAVIEIAGNAGYTIDWDYQREKGD